MPNFAIHDWHKVSNVIVCDTQALAEELTGQQALETTGEPWIDWLYVDGAWIPPQPGPEYVWNGTEWIIPEAPVE